MSDATADMWTRACGGDISAFMTVIAEHDRALRSLAFRLLGDRDRMEDALQEAYVKAFRALPGFRHESGMGTWIYRVVYNACMDELRRRRVVVPIERLNEVPAAGPEPGSRLADRER